MKIILESGAWKLDFIHYWLV